MQLFALITRKAALPLKALSLVAAGSSLCTVGIMVLVNRAAQDIASEGIDNVDWLMAGLFCVALALFLVFELRLLSRFAVLVEDAIHEARCDLIGLLRMLNPAQRDRIGDAELFDCVTQASNTISQNSQYIAIAFRSAIMVIAILGYIFATSKATFVMLTLAILFAGYVYFRRGQQVMQSHMQVAADDRRMFEQITDQLDGWKEVRMFRPRREKLAAAFDRSVERAAESRIEMQNVGFDLYIFGQLALFFLLGVVVFVVPSYTDISAGNLTKTATAVLFIIGPIGLVVQAVAVLGAAEASATRILGLEARLLEYAASSGEHASADPVRFAQFERIVLEDAEYEYPAKQDVEPFHLGPVNLHVARGEILFISGGNGSGKSTLMRILTGLYVPSAGRLKVDGRAISEVNAQDFRAQIASVLSDFHLFPELFGLRSVPAETVAAQLRLFELEGIVGVEGARFTTLNLSTGQKKRLALVVALLEDRPLLVLDEWAADQDPHFRKKFYREILPKLKTEGKTIIAVTHDDAYFDVADRRIHLSEGMQIDAGPAAPAGN
ncbi:cyclic peptide export ABC transporter [Ruegeria sp. 2205SS24-7]|uniref:cyclic peptide export ABC transporter n=1 Tax=Ruegeria discodermiae TaxID=3064389 RepID=UPI0027419920|nr:cyclic peptide export ABC transporter [Ruegeria sp. 2205SS24-7]MDP5218858.1 cyclic peptide export ABC transporter [Ruegeria sp. 2205SS24-7]